MSFVVRNIKEDDFEQIHSLSKLTTFINLPSNKDLLKEKISSSIQTFEKPHKNLENNYYIFVLENTDTSEIIGASMIHGKHGTEEEPHFFLRVGQEHKLSKTLNTGFIHGTLNFDYETNGHSEIGGLILHPDYRGHKESLGKLLSYSRFLYIGLHLDEFTEQIHCELMPPLDSDGNSPLWESIGRKFLNLDYQEADKLSRKNKEFILSLYPQDTIYQTLLPAKAREIIGKVGKSTLPVKNMLEKIGFVYTDEVDPFDGGPHYRADKKDISLIKNQKSTTLKIVEKLSNPSKILVNLPHQDYKFYGLVLEGEFIDNHLHIEKSMAIKLKLTDNDNVTGILL